MADHCSHSTHPLFCDVFLFRETSQCPFARRHRAMARDNESGYNHRRSKRHRSNLFDEGVLCVWPTGQRGIVFGQVIPRNRGGKDMAVSLEF